MERAQSEQMLEDHGKLDYRIFDAFTTQTDAVLDPWGLC